MTRIVLILGGMIAAAASGPAIGRAVAEADTPEAVLENHGLRRVGSLYVLPEEPSLRPLLDALKRDGQEWSQLNTRRDQVERELRTRHATLAKLERQRASLREAVASARERRGPGDDPRNFNRGPMPGMGPGPPPGMGPGPDFGPGPSHSPFLPPPPPPPGGPGSPDEGMPPPPPYMPDRKGAQRADEVRNAQIRRLDSQVVQTALAIVRAEEIQRRIRAQLDRRQLEFRRRLAFLGERVTIALKHVEDLAARSDVQKALASLPDAAGSRFQLGPAHDYRAELDELSGTLRKLAGATTPGSAFDDDIVTRGGLDLRTLAGVMEAFPQELGSVLTRIQSHRSDAVLRSKRIDELRASGRSIDPASPAARETRERLKRLETEASDEERALDDLDEQLIALRSGLVRGSAQLRKLLDRDSQPRPLPGVDASTTSATGKAQTKGSTVASSVVTPALVEQVRSLLDRLDATIATNMCALEPDMTRVWVRARLDGKTEVPMLLDPLTETTRVPGSVARDLGAVSDDRPTVHLRARDGRSLPARSLANVSIQIGDTLVERLSILVLPEGDETPAVLGADLLDRFVYRIDSEAATLTLVKVDIKPFHSRGTAQSAATARPREKP